MGDYIFPKVVTDILKRPSERTQIESTLVGITMLMLGSLGIAGYFIFAEDHSLMFKLLIGLSEFGILLFQFSLLATTYQTYHQYKLEKGFYPIDYELKMKIEEAKMITKDLNTILSKININKREENKC